MADPNPTLTASRVIPPYTYVDRVDCIARVRAEAYADLTFLLSSNVRYRIEETIEGALVTVAAVPMEPTGLAEVVG